MMGATKAFFLFLFVFILGGCHTNKSLADNTSNMRVTEPTEPSLVEAPPAPKNTPEPEAPQDATQKIDTSTLNAGIGPISFLALDDPIDSTMAALGEKIYKNNCTACHKINTDFIGPKIYGVIEKRNPAWIMNMILNADEMLRVDKDAMALLEVYKAPMPYFAGNIDDARAIVEYMRTLTSEE